MNNISKEKIENIYSNQVLLRTMGLHDIARYTFSLNNFTNFEQLRNLETFLYDSCEFGVCLSIYNETNKCFT